MVQELHISNQVHNSDSRSLGRGTSDGQSLLHIDDDLGAGAGAVDPTLLLSDASSFPDPVADGSGSRNAIIEIEDPYAVDANTLALYKFLETDPNTQGLADAAGNFPFLSPGTTFFGQGESPIFGGGLAQNDSGTASVTFAATTLPEVTVEFYFRAKNIIQTGGALNAAEALVRLTGGRGFSFGGNTSVASSMTIFHVGDTVPTPFSSVVGLDGKIHHIAIQRKSAGFFSVIFDGKKETLALDGVGGVSISASDIVNPLLGLSTSTVGYGWEVFGLRVSDTIVYDPTNAISQGGTVWTPGITPAFPRLPEIVTYTGKSGNSLTGVTRGQLGSVGQVHVSGRRVWLSGTTGEITGPKLRIADGLTEMNGSDILNIREGTHINATSLRLPPDGTAAQKTTIRTLPGDDQAIIVFVSWAAQGISILWKNLQMQLTGQFSGSGGKTPDFEDILAIGTGLNTFFAGTGFAAVRCEFKDLAAVHNSSPRFFNQNIVRNCVSGITQTPVEGIKNCVFINCGTAVLSVSQSVTLARVNHNTFIGCDVAIKWTHATWGAVSQRTDYFNNVFLFTKPNSIAFLHTGDPGLDNEVDATQAHHAFDKNIYFIGPGGAGSDIGSVNGVTFTTRANWETYLKTLLTTFSGAGQTDENSLETDPLVKSLSIGNEDFHLSLDSPAIGVGFAAGEQRDVDNEFRSLSAPTIGADEPTGDALPFQNVLLYPPDLQSTIDATTTLAWLLGNNPGGGTIQFQGIIDKNVGGLTGEITGASTFDVDVDTLATVPGTTLKARLDLHGISVAGMRLYVKSGGSTGIFEVTDITADIITVSGTFGGGVESGITWELSRALFSESDEFSRLTKIDSHGGGTFEIDHTAHDTTAPVVGKRKKTFEQSVDYPGGGNPETVAGTWSDIGRGANVGSPGVSGVDGADAASEDPVFVRTTLHGEDKVDEATITATVIGSVLTDTGKFAALSGIDPSAITLRMGNTETEYVIDSFDNDSVTIVGPFDAGDLVPVAGPSVAYNVFANELENPSRYSFEMDSWGGQLL